MIGRERVEDALEEGEDAPEGGMMKAGFCLARAAGRKTKRKTKMRARDK